MAAPADDRVELTELDVIARYSLAVRAASVPRDELIATLRADLAWLEGAGATAQPAAAGRAPARAAATRKAAARKAPTRSAAAKKP
jgi:hypothetical protein